MGPPPRDRTAVQMSPPGPASAPPPPGSPTPGTPLRRSGRSARCPPRSARCPPLPPPASRHRLLPPRKGA
eukprot:2464221-Pyramimonas_sp.AAC.1